MHALRGVHVGLGVGLLVLLGDRHAERVPQLLQELAVQLGLLGHVVGGVAWARRPAPSPPAAGPGGSAPRPRAGTSSSNPSSASSSSSLRRDSRSSPSRPSSRPSFSKSIVGHAERAAILCPGAGLPSVGAGDRQGRAAHHRPRPARPVRLPPGRRARRGGRGQRAGGPLRPPADPGRGDLDGVGERGRRPSAWSSRSRRWRPTCRPRWCAWACGWPRSTAPRPPGAWRWCCRPAPAPARRAPAAGAAVAAGVADHGGLPVDRARRAGWARARSPRCGRWPAARCAPPRWCRTSGCDHAGLRRLEELGLIELRGQDRAGAAPRAARTWGAKPEAGELTAAQRAALAEVTAALDAREPLLLHGVTGSGKTEVYLRAVEETLARGRSAIVLVPEIALTPQTAGRFVQRFGDRVAVLHSALDRPRALRRVGPAAQRRRARLRRPPLGGVRAGGGPRPDRGRRGARPLLQAGGRPALRRPPGGRAPRRAGGRGAAGRHRHAPARGLARRCGG